MASSGCGVAPRRSKCRPKDRSANGSPPGVKIFLYYIGKPKDPHANAIAEDFLGRVGRYAPAAMREIRPERTDLRTKHPTARLIFLDPSGKSIDSAQFAEIVR